MLIASRMPGMLRRSRDRWLLGTLFACHAFPIVAAVPRGHRAYFNILAEGLGGADRVLLDSNLDWGQDLPRSAAWMRRRGVKHVQLGHFGSDRPGRYGIHHRDLAGEHLYRAHPPRIPFRGIVVLGPNLLHNLLGWPDPHPYAWLLYRKPDDRAEVFFMYRFADAGPDRQTPGPRLPVPD